MGIGHYENFPVASIILPARLREPVTWIYRFAREADDIADEGDAPPHERLAALAERRADLDRIAGGEAPRLALYRGVREVIRAHDLPIQLFRDLLDAFSQDITTTRYANFADLTDYCRRSANPVGRLLLHLQAQTAPTSLAWSDRICSSLQLVNFLQDIAIDMRKGRIYLPQDEMARFGIDEDRIRRGDASGPWSAFMQFQIDRARALLLEGAPLGRALHGRFALELRMIVSGGERILDKLARVSGDVFRSRPVLTATDWPLLLARALFRQP
jgi:squalene synthase HpnC